MSEIEAIKRAQHWEQAHRDMMERFRAQESELNRLREGWKTESREARKFFEQSCKNLERAKNAEKQVEYLSGNLLAARRMSPKGIDHACAECIPHGTAIIKGFKCWRHCWVAVPDNKK